MKNLLFKEILHSVTLHKKKFIFFTFFIIIVIAMIYILWGHKFYAAYKQYRLWEKNKIILEEKIKKLNLSIFKKKYFIKKFMIDRNFREQVAHEQNGFLNANEYVVYFKKIEKLTPDKKSLEKD